MADVLLSLTLPTDIAEHVEDLLLLRPDLVRGFTASLAEGHGSVVPLVAPSELVSGHSPRIQIRMVGAEENMRAVLALIKAELPSANIFFWLVPVIEMGRL
ncbi:MAG TPA: DUF3240 family protein [Azonexus sp.]|nr:DUF3240 family protein [Azonexus sp.]